MADFWAQFTVAQCPECGLEHAPIRTCDEAREFHNINKENNS